MHVRCSIENKKKEKCHHYHSTTLFTAVSRRSRLFTSKYTSTFYFNKKETTASFALVAMSMKKEISF